MKTALTAAIAVAMAFVSVRAGAQTLVDAAKRAEDNRKANTVTPVTFDERDVNPSLAARELLDYAISEERWQKFVAADNRIMNVMEKDPALYGRLEVLRANSARMIERFLMREPSLLKALKAAGTDPHEYAYTSVAIGVALALIANDPGPTVFEQLPDATKTNIAFVRGHEAEIKPLLARGERLREKVHNGSAERPADAHPDASDSKRLPKVPSKPDEEEPDVDMDAAIAIMSYELNEKDWQRFVVAQTRVLDILERDLVLAARLLGQPFRVLDEKKLRGVILSEPVIVKAVAEAGMSPAEYVTARLATEVAIVMAFQNPSPELKKNAPPGVEANVEFLRAREPAVRALTARGLAIEARLKKR